MKAGGISGRDHWRQRTREVGRLVGEDWADMVRLVQRARGAEPALILRPEARAAITAAHAAGVRLAILSNELDLFCGAGLRQRFPLIDRFEVIVDASHTGILKPDPRAFATVLQALAPPPAARDRTQVGTRPCPRARQLPRHGWLGGLCRSGSGGL